MCPVPARAAGAGLDAGAADAANLDTAWVDIAFLNATGALAPLPGMTGRGSWVVGYAFANEVQVHPVTLAAIPTERYLVFQPDGMLCGPTSAAALDVYAPYAYVGAPFAWDHDLSRGEAPAGGNGGFSLRSRSVMWAVVSRFGGAFRGDDTHEDFFFTEYVPRVGAALPPARLAWAFSVETMYAGPPLGMHKPWKFAGWGRKLGIRLEDFRDLVWLDCPVLASVLAAHDVSLPAPPPPDMPRKPAELPVYEIAFFLACLVGTVAAIGAALYAVLRFLEGKERPHLHRT